VSARGMKRCDSARGGRGITSKNKPGHIKVDDLDGENFSTVMETPRRMDKLKGVSNIRKINLLQLN